VETKRVRELLLRDQMSLQYCFNDDKGSKDLLAV